MSTDRLAEIANRLAQDWWVRAPYRRVDLADIDEAYAVQGLLRSLLAERRGPIAGRKIALSSKAMQDMVGIDQPIAGTFFESDVQVRAAEVSLSGFRHMGLEAELAFRLGRSVAPGDTLADLPALISEVYPAFELVEDKDADYRNLDALTLVADNAWCGGVVLGAPILGWQALDLDGLPGVLSQTGQPDETTDTGAASPWTSLRWLLEHCQARGDVLQAGEVLITGSAVRTRFPVRGDVVRYDVTGHSSVELAIT